MVLGLADGPLSAALPLAEREACLGGAVTLLIVGTVGVLSAFNGDALDIWVALEAGTTGAFCPMIISMTLCI